MKIREILGCLLALCLLASLALMASSPAFAQGTDATFLDQEAGIAAYIDAEQALDLSKDCL